MSLSADLPATGVSERTKPLTATDLKILALLRENARLSVAALAHRTGVSRATVQNRLSRMENEGVISGYTLRMPTPPDATQIRAMMSLAIDGNRMREVTEALRLDLSVHALHTTNGRWDLIAEIRANNLESFDRALERIRLLPGIATTETNLLLTSFKS